MYRLEEYELENLFNIHVFVFAIRGKDTSVEFY